MASRHHQEHRQRVGPYRVEFLKGTGGMGEVYCALDPRLERKVALKRIRPERSGKPGVRKRLFREAKAIARLNHQNIAQIYDLVVEDDEVWLVMEWVEGDSLRDLLLQDGPMPVERGLELAVQIVEGLAEAHKAGVIHRDLKSGNVMIADDDCVKILDFGLAKLDSIAEGSSENLTKDGAILGTPRSMAPEQALGRRFDHRADFFSLGVLFYELFTGKPAFEAPTVAAALQKVCSEDPVSPQALRPSIPGFLAALITDLLEKDPTNRPRSCWDVLQRLLNQETGRTLASTGSRRLACITTLETTHHEDAGDPRALHASSNSRGKERHELRDFNYLQLLLEREDVASLLTAFEDLSESDPLREVQEALRISAHALWNNKALLPGQLLGRLRGHRDKDVANLLHGTLKWSESDWLEPKTRSLIPPGGPLSCTIRERTKMFNSLIALDKSQILCADKNNSLGLWNIENGRKIRKFEGHTSSINSVFVLDPQHIVSSASDQTVRIWNSQTGREVRRLNGFSKTRVPSKHTFPSLLRLQAKQPRSLGLANRQSPF